MTLKELQAKATELNISGRSKMNKAELEAAVDAMMFAKRPSNEYLSQFNRSQEADRRLNRGW